MHILKCKSLLITLMLTLSTVLQAVEDDDIIWEMENKSCHHCNDECSPNVILKYRVPENSEGSSRYGVYVSILTINTETVVTNKETFRIATNEIRNARFYLHLNSNQTLVAFVVSFDHDFATFSTPDVGALKAVVDCQTVQIPLAEYESNIAIGYFDLEDL